MSLSSPSHLSSRVSSAPSAMREGESSLPKVGKQTVLATRSLILSSLLMMACGRSSLSTSTEENSCPQEDLRCEEVKDCHCPEDYRASCEEGTCYCLKSETLTETKTVTKTETVTETVVVHDNSVVVKELKCNHAEDCDCPDDASVTHDASCREGVCYCTGTKAPEEVPQECYPISRGELAVTLINSIDGFAGYEAPATPTFNDVPTDSPYFDYVEAAVQLGIVYGYTDAEGKLTGFFGPGDLINRAQVSKILVDAFDIPTDLTPGSVFPDVPITDWYYDYVVTAYNHSLVDGYTDGLFHPIDPASSCFTEITSLRATSR